MDTNETKIFLALLMAAAVIALIFVFYIVSLVKQHKKNVALYKEKIHAEITTLEKERKRFVADLHDDFGPLLSSIKFHVGSITLQEQEDLVLQHKTLGLINDLMANIHRVANNLMPSILEKKGLLTALKQYADDITHTGKIIVQLDNNSHHEPLHLTTYAQVHLFRVLQESVNNALKHAHATLISIGITDCQEHYIFTVRDNGIGYDAGAVTGNTGRLGLKNILNRVEMLHGDIDIETGTGKGTRYIITIPKTS